MSRKFLTPVDLTGLELQNAKIQNLATNPAAFGKGHVYYNTVANELRIYDGSTWVPVGGSMEYGNTASRPAAGNAGRSYADTQTQTLYVDNGTAWVQIGVSGTADYVNAINGTTNQILASTDGGTTTLSLDYDVKIDASLQVGGWNDEDDGLFVVKSWNGYKAFEVTTQGAAAAINNQYHGYNTYTNKTGLIDINSVVNLRSEDNSPSGLIFANSGSGASGFPTVHLEAYGDLALRAGADGNDGNIILYTGETSGPGTGKVYIGWNNAGGAGANANNQVATIGDIVDYTYITSVTTDFSVTSGELAVNALNLASTLSSYFDAAGTATSQGYITASGQYIQSVGSYLSVSGTQLELGEDVVITDATQTLTNKTLNDVIVTGTTSFRDGNNDEYLYIEKSGTGAARFVAADDLSLRATNDIILYPGNDAGGHTGKAYIHWGNDATSSHPEREITTAGNTQDITNKTIADELYFKDTVSQNGAEAGIKINGSNENLEIRAYTNDILITSNNGDVVLDADGDIYKHSASSGNELVTRDDAVILANKTLGSGTTLGADLNANEYKITGLSDPTEDYDAANKRYVDAATAGLTWKQAVNVHVDAAEVTARGIYVDNGFLTAAISSGLLVLDGHTLVNADAGYRILVTGTDTAADGIWVLQTVAELNWLAVRAADADVFGELKGAAVFVMEGDHYGSTSWVQSSHYITNFTGQTWAQFSGQGTYTAGDGLELNGSEFSAKLDGGSLTKSGDGLKVNLYTNGGLAEDGGLYVNTGTGLTITGSNTVEIDTNIVARKIAEAIGNGVLTSFVITHDFGTRDVMVTVYDTASYAEVFTDVAHSSINTVTVSFAEAPTTGQYRVVIVG